MLINRSVPLHVAHLNLEKLTRRQFDFDMKYAFLVVMGGKLLYSRNLPLQQPPGLESNYRYTAFALAKGEPKAT